MGPTLPALSCSWKTDYAAVLKHASCVSAKAHAACAERILDRVFMTSPSFADHQATAVFGCLGADP